MGKLNYNGWHWEGEQVSEGETLVVRMSDGTFQRHLSTYLASVGITQPTYQDRYEGIQHLSNLEHWRTCTDPEVRIHQLRRRQTEQRTS